MGFVRNEVSGLRMLFFFYCEKSRHPLEVALTQALQLLGRVWEWGMSLRGLKTA